MKPDKGSKRELEIQLEEVIEKSKAQKEILQKVLHHLNKQNDDRIDSDNKQKSKNI